MLQRHIIYKLGMLFLLPVIVIGELLWILDPLRLPNGYYLMDYVGALVVAASVIPFLWTAASLSGLFDRSAALPLKLIRMMNLCSSAAAVLLLAYNPREILWLGISLGTSFLLVCADLILSEYAQRRAFPRRHAAWTGSFLVILAFLLWPTNYLVTYPGMTMNMNRYALVERGEVKEEIAGVLIFERPAFPVDWLYAALLPHYTFEKTERLGMSLSEYNHVVQVMKHDANTVAAAVALQKAGVGKGAVYDGVVVAAVMIDGPAEGYLHAGDRIVGMNGQTVSRSEQLLQALKTVTPGQNVRLAVFRSGETVEVEVPTAGQHDDASRAVMGIQIMNHVQYDVPVDIDFRQYLLHEGGPSHGAMLALTIIDQLTPGGVTNGNRVAGTGTIRADGSIGPVGGVTQKAFTVERSGADVFFVPQGQEEEARKGADRLRIIPVGSIDDVLNWLKAHPKHND